VILPKLLGAGFFSLLPAHCGGFFFDDPSSKVSVWQRSSITGARGRRDVGNGAPPHQSFAGAPDGVESIAEIIGMSAPTSRQRGARRNTAT